MFTLFKLLVDFLALLVLSPIFFQFPLDQLSSLPFCLLGKVLCFINLKVLIITDAKMQSTNLLWYRYVNLHAVEYEQKRNVLALNNCSVHFGINKL